MTRSRRSAPLRATAPDRATAPSAPRHLPVSPSKLAALALPFAAMTIAGTPPAQAAPLPSGGPPGAPQSVPGPSPKLRRPKPPRPSPLRQYPNTRGPNTQDLADAALRRMDLGDISLHRVHDALAEAAHLPRPPSPTSPIEAPRPVNGPRRPPRARVRAPGSITAFGDARFVGAPGPGGKDLVGIAVAPNGKGYWAVDSAGTVFTYGDAASYGSLSPARAAGGIAAIAATPTGRGYWLVTRAGGVFTFGDATFHGSLGKTPLGKPVVGFTPTARGKGYWLATADGGVYSFGNARFFGSLGHTVLHRPVVGIAAAPGGRGYWLATAGGGVYTFGHARFLGSLVPSGPEIRSIAPARPHQGYWLLGSNGTVHGFGAAANFGSVITGSNLTASYLAPTDNGRGYLLAVARSPAVPRRVHSGLWHRRAGRLTSALAAPAQTFVGDFEVTCYDLTGPTASGAMAGPQSVAVDPQVIPLGAQIYIQGVGERTADDTGSAIIGNHIDIWEPTYATCADWGVQVRAVYRISGR